MKVLKNNELNMVHGGWSSIVEPNEIESFLDSLKEQSEEERRRRSSGNEGPA